MCMQFGVLVTYMWYKESAIFFLEHFLQNHIVVVISMKLILIYSFYTRLL